MGIQIWQKKTYITTNLKLQQNSVNQIFYPTAFLLFLLTGASWYNHAIYIVLKYFASFTGYEDYIFEIISNSQFQESKFGRNIYQFSGEKSWIPQSSLSLFFSSLLKRLNTWHTLIFNTKHSMTNNQQSTLHPHSILKTHHLTLNNLHFKLNNVNEDSTPSTQHPPYSTKHWELNTQMADASITQYWHPSSADHSKLDALKTIDALLYGGTLQVQQFK